MSVLIKSYFQHFSLILIFKKEKQKESVKKAVTKEYRVNERKGERK